MLKVDTIRPKYRENFLSQKLQMGLGTILFRIFLRVEYYNLFTSNSDGQILVLITVKKNKKTKSASVRFINLTIRKN